MAQVLVRNITDDVLNHLKARADNNGRSLQAELKLILEQAATNNSQKLSFKVFLERTEQLRVSTAGRQQSDSVQLLHEGRER